MRLRNATVRNGVDQRKVMIRNVSLGRNSKMQEVLTDVWKASVFMCCQHLQTVWNSSGLQS